MTPSEAFRLVMLAGSLLSLVCLIIVYSVLGNLAFLAYRAANPKVKTIQAVLSGRPPKGARFFMPTIHWPQDVPSWVGLITLLLTAMNALLQKDYQAASIAFGGAMGILGIGSTARSAAIYAKQANVSANIAATDTAEIRNNPSMPGAPVSAIEMIDRAEAARKAL